MFDEEERDTPDHEPEQRWFPYDAELFARAGMGTLERDFILTRNPTDHRLTWDAGLGLEPALHIKLYQLLTPEKEQMSAREIAARVGKYQMLASWLAYTRLVWEPRGTLLVPKIWAQALRRQHPQTGEIISGGVPFLLFGDETDETAPPIRSCLQFQTPVPRTRTGQTTARVAQRKAAK